jgi:hypothetical protein
LIGLVGSIGCLVWFIGWLVGWSIGWLVYKTFSMVCQSDFRFSNLKNGCDLELSE